MTGSSPLSLIASLRGALEAARGVRSRNDLVFALDRIAAVIADGLGYRSVAINLHRPAWDDFEAIDGPRPGRRAPGAAGQDVELGAVGAVLVALRAPRRAPRPGSVPSARRPALTARRPPRARAGTRDLLLAVMRARQRRRARDHLRRRAARRAPARPTTTAIASSRWPRSPRWPSSRPPTPSATPAIAARWIVCSASRSSPASSAGAPASCRPSAPGSARRSASSAPPSCWPRTAGCCGPPRPRAGPCTTRSSPTSPSRWRSSSRS